MKTMDMIKIIIIKIKEKKNLQIIATIIKMIMMMK